MGISAESFTKLFEQAQLETQPQAGAAMPATTPPNAGTQPPPQQPAQQPQEVAQNKQSGDVVTLDKIVDHLNGIRSGKSFTDPLVYTSLSNIFNSLSAAEKAVLDKVVSQLDASITQITKQQSPPNPNNQEAKGPAIEPSMGVNQQQSPNSFQGPQAAQQAMSQTPMAGMMSGVLAEAWKDTAQGLLHDRPRKKMLFTKLETKPNEIADLILKVIKPRKRAFMAGKNVSQFFDEVLVFLVNAGFLGEDMSARIEGKTFIGKLTPASIVTIYRNLDRIKPRAEELQVSPPANPSKEDKILMAVFPDERYLEGASQELETIKSILRNIRTENESENVENDDNKLKELVLNVVSEYSNKDFALNPNSDVYIYESSLSSLVESLNKPTGAMLINGKEVMFGSDEHLNQVRVVVDGLESIKNCYKKGSSIRYTLSAACGRLRKILKDSELKAERSALNSQPVVAGD